MQRPPQTPVLRRSAEKGSLPKSPAPGECLPTTTHARQRKTPKPTLGFVYRGPPPANGGHLEPVTCQSSPPATSHPAGLGALLPRQRPGRSPPRMGYGALHQRAIPKPPGSRQPRGAPAQAASASAAAGQLPGPAEAPRPPLTSRRARVRAQPRGDALPAPRSPSAPRGGHPRAAPAPPAAAALPAAYPARAAAAPRLTPFRSWDL